MHFIVAVGRLSWDWSEAPKCDTVVYSTTVLLHLSSQVKQWCIKKQKLCL